jgi:glutamyl-tRNA synthetase
MSNAEDIIYKEVMINAYKYGSADKKIVLKKLMANYPELRNKVKEIQPILDNIISEVNEMPEDKLHEIVEEKYPESIVEETKERDYLPEIVNAVKGKVTVRYPPEPSKHPHIGQMLSFCINHLIAERYEGKRILRFDDTNPEKVQSEFYDSFREAIHWMNLKIDGEVLASDHLELYYEKAKELIEKNEAFICTCDRDTMAKLRNEEKPCSCNLENSIEKNLESFEKMLEGHYNQGEAVIRLRGDMSSKNAVLRDPVLLRISHHAHCIQGDKYILWPMYDFESPIMEDYTGVTHILRSIEFGKMREELQSLISSKLGLKTPEFLEYARFNVTGAPTQGRVIRELVDQEIVTGWDDYRLVTYQALKRRGIQPETFSEIIRRVGATKSATNIDWSLISAINRKFIEPSSKHFFFVDNPITVKLTNPKSLKVDIDLHPNNKDLGSRQISVEDTLYLSRLDLNILKVNEVIRMKDLYNIKIIEKVADSEFTAEIMSEDLLGDVPRVQWVSDPVSVEIVKPEMLYLNNRINKDSLKNIQGYGEKELINLKVGEIVQLERFGYTKVNKITDKVKMNYIHS